MHFIVPCKYIIAWARLLFLLSFAFSGKSIQIHYSGAPQTRVALIMFLESCFCAYGKCPTNSNWCCYQHSPTRWENGQSIFSRHFSCFFVIFYARENCWHQEKFWFEVDLYFCKFSLITRKSQLTLTLHASTATTHIVLRWRAECVLVLVAAPPIGCGMRRCNNIQCAYQFIIEFRRKYVHFLRWFTHAIFVWYFFMCGTLRGCSKTWSIT